MISSMNELIKHIAKQCHDLDLSYDCGPDGPINAEIACIGEYPGDTEVRSKRPMSGGAGRLLWECLNKMGHRRTSIYVTNVSKRQLSIAAGDIKKVLSLGEQQHWNNLLKWELGQLRNLRCIVVLGSLALEALTEEKGINHWRGSVVKVTVGTHPDEMREVPCVIVNNPANAIRNPKEEVIFRFHLAKLNRVLENKWNPFHVQAHYNPSYREALTWIDALHREAVRDNKSVAFDIETIAGETACVGFASSEREGFCINFRTRDENRFSLEEERDIYRRIQRFLGDTRVKFIAQNGNFDSYWLGYKDRLMVHGIWLDTMLAHHLLYPRLPHDLGFLCSQYTDHPYYKDQGAEWREGGDIDSFWEYNVLDCCITLECATVLKRELRAAKLDGFFFTHVMRAQPHLVRSTILGLRIDEELRDPLRTSLQEEVQELLYDFHRMVFDELGDPDYRPNPGSPKQMQELYFKRLRLIGRGLSTNEANRTRMHDHIRTSEGAKKIIQAHNKWAKEQKFLSTYANMEADPDERIRCEYKQTGVQSAPGRLSSASVMWGSGMNLQNQPERSKSMFLADPGYVFCYFDLSQAEARFVAVDANIPLWKEQFERARLDGSYDCHRALASEMFKVPYEETPTSDIDENGNRTIRYTSKRCRHGLNYRMQAAKLAEVTGLPLREAEAAFNIYHRITPELREWWDRLAKEAIANRVLRNVYGRRLIIMERIDDTTLDAIVAFRPQSTIGDKVVQVWYQCEEDPKWPSDARVCLNVHDALIALCRPHHAARVLSIMRHYAEKPIRFESGEELIIPAELAVSVPDDKGYHRWSTLKKIKDPSDVSSVVHTGSR